MNIFTSAEQLIGKTPLLRLTHIEKEFNLDAKIFAKLEFLNPAGSIKDRVARKMIEAAEKSGELKSDSVIIEPTSGNTGIGLAAVATAKGYKTIIVMPDTMSLERRQLIKAYGAELVLSDGSLGMSGAIAKAEELKKNIPNSIIAGQFVNPENYKAHFETTGPEIFQDTDGKIDILVCGIGTGGTITGIGKYLKSQKAEIQVIGIEPASSPFLTKGKSGSHQIQGIGAGFIPEILDTKIYDKLLTVEDKDAFNTGKLIGRKEGILVGISSGAALHGAIQVAQKAENKGKNIVVIFPDSADRYLSTPLFSD